MARRRLSCKKNCEEKRGEVAEPTTKWYNKVESFARATEWSLKVVRVRVVVLELHNGRGQREHYRTSDNTVEVVRQ